SPIDSWQDAETCIDSPSNGAREVSGQSTCRRRRSRRTPAPVPWLSSIYLRSELPRHEGADRAASRLTLEQYSIHCVDNWHLNSFTPRQLARALRRDHTFGDSLSTAQDFLKLSPLPDFNPDSPVATERASAGQHQIAESGQARESALLSAKSSTESRHLGKATGDQRC